MLYIISSALMVVLCMVVFYNPTELLEMYNIVIALVAMASGCKVIDRRFIAEHVRLESIYKYNHLYAFLTLSALLISYSVHHYDVVHYFVAGSAVAWVILTLGFFFIFQEPPRERANYNTY
mmetsp:Transcript_37478/g.36041  ORF Transcript_37478/g.36041 Transcript_37478/m.36041 type:complete len:121 (+) Transcript_37478:1245-1607(+)